MDRSTGSLLALIAGLYVMALTTAALPPLALVTIPAGVAIVRRTVRASRTRRTRAAIRAEQAATVRMIREASRW